MERQAMRERFPGFPLTMSLDGQLLWVGTLESALPGGGRYSATVIYPERYPDEPPEVRIIDPEIPANVPHQLSPGRPCLYRPLNDPRYGYSPANTTAATLVAWTSLWIHAYETWQATRVWPGQED
jgi:hypothetical protein